MNVLDHQSILGAEENAILQYLRSFPGHLVAESEIARRADGIKRYQEDSRWTRSALRQLIEAELVECVEGRFRLRASKPVLNSRVRFLSPEMRQILEQNKFTVPADWA